MPDNNFQKLEEQNIRKFDAQRNKRVKNNLTSTTGVMHFIGHLVELYIPNFMNVFVKLTGGQGPNPKVSDKNASQNTDRDIPKYPNTKEI